MRTICFANNHVGLKIVDGLRNASEDLAALVVHPAERSRFGYEIRRASGLPDDRIFDASTLSEPKTMDRIRELSPEIGVSAFFGYIFKPEFISIFPKGIVNIHPALLPYNRGANPNIWSIVDGTPAGVTLHYVDSGVDTGGIIAQREIPVEPIDTGESLYRKLETASVALFQENWPALKSGKTKTTVQTRETGSFHKAADVEKIDRIDLDKSYRARDLLDLIRARTFTGYTGAYFESSGRRVYLKMQLEYGPDERDKK
jgi:methionyl-tRNA formyltransferase